MESAKVTEEMEGRAVETSAPGTEIQILVASGLSSSPCIFILSRSLHLRHACSTIWQVNDHLAPQGIRESADRKERPFV